ncbi:SPOR domain-containing protein [Cardinium endosymbiont of Philonthus spinipes]|uniref:SPOR domain-containing protein n=1 Tax=Cardinium endosymbiont of Philonthus spinipes TaxID=3077941 RepID=UPI00313C7E7C
MATNPMDNKFGLPKPDFQALPKKKAIWPLLVILGMIVLLIAAKMGYNLYMNMHKHPTSAVESATKAANNRPDSEQTNASEKSAPATTTAKTRARKDGNKTADSSLDEAEIFEHKQNKKVTKSISATQKQLAAKRAKPLIKPGTYQAFKEPQGIYHLVVGSYLDKSAAMKVVQELMKKNLGVCLILPRTQRSEKYYRVTIGHSKTQDEAEKKLKQFESKYKNIFILEY